MALYKVEYWVQMSTDHEAYVRHTSIYASNTDRKMKMYASGINKFHPDYSTRWKVLEDGDHFTIWKRALKSDVLAGWNKSFNIKELQRFIIVKKAISDEAYEILKTECDNKPINAYSTY